MFGDFGGPDRRTGGDRRADEDRFADLDPSTRAFLRRLRDDEIAQLQEAIDFMRSVRMVGRFTRWALYTVVAAFLGAIAVGEGFSSLRRLIAEWFNGGGR